MKTRTLVAALLVGTRALANTTWQGDEGDSWHESFNWTANVPDGSDTAFFGAVAAGNSTTPRLFIPGVYDVGAISFVAGAPAFTITVDHTPFVQSVVLNIVGAGITNNSGNTQSIMNAGESGTDGAGMTSFRNNATSDINVVITNLPPFVSGGSGGRTDFYNNSNPGGATILNRGDGLLSQFGSTTRFFDDASASNATINNQRGRANTFTQFTENSTAGNAQITNQGALEPSGFSEPGRGVTQFSGTSDAGTANITNQGGIGMNGVGGTGGGTTFSATASANGAIILNLAGTDAGDGGRTGFSGDSTAGDATITSNGAIGLNNGAGFVTFSGTSDAGTAMITAGGGGAFGSGAMTSFTENSSAANATLVTNGGSFGGRGGQTFFTGSASGGEAVVITNAAGTFDISGLTTTGTTVGSIAGAGSYALGGKNLTVGLGFAGVFADTQASGLISGTGGSLTKTGVGALTLSGVNTYTGGTILNAGRLSVDNNAALGAGTLQIFGGILGSHVANTIISNNVTVSGDFTISPPSGLFAQLQLAGDVNLGATTHVVRPENSNFATFSGRLLGTTAGVSFFSSNSVEGNFILSGSFSNVYGGTTSVQGNLLNNGSVQLFLAKASGAVALPGNVTINFGGAVTLLENEQIADNAGVTVNFGGNFRVNAQIERIGALNGNGSVVLNDGSAGGSLFVGSGDFDGGVADGGLGGQLIKMGPGTLFLSGINNTYTGGTRVEGGILAVDNISGSATGTAAVIVQPSAVLSGGNTAGTAGLIGGPVIIQDMGHLQPGLTVGTLTFQSDLTLSPLSQVDFELGQPGVDGGANNDLVKVFGNLTLDGALNISSIGFAGGGDYTIFIYGNRLFDNGLAIGTIPNGFDSSQFTIDVSIPNEVILHVVPEPENVALLLAGVVSISTRLRRMPSNSP